MRDAFYETAGVVVFSTLFMRVVLVYMHGYGVGV